MNGRVGVRCASCGSLERTRALKLVLDHLKLPQANSTVLHFAPEAGLARCLSEASPSGYDGVDISPENFPNLKVRKFDIITDCPSLPSNHYDLILHSHVAEHIPCNLAFMFYHFSRALKPSGFHVFCIPIMSGHYDEYFGPLTSDEAVRRFGQNDHVRRFGIDDLHLHLGMIMKLKKQYDLSDYVQDKIMDEYNIPTKERSGLNSSTIFVTRKSDYLLQ